MGSPARSFAFIATFAASACALALLDCSTARSSDASRDRDQHSLVANTKSALAWSLGAVPPVPLTGHTATLLGDGRVLLTGGDSSLDQTFLFDPSTSTFTPGPKMLAARTHHTATMLLSGKVLIFGALNDTSADLYDPITSTIAKTGSLANARDAVLATRLDDGRVYVLEGSSGATAEIYDPSTGTFVTAPAPPLADATVLVKMATGKLFIEDAGSAVIYDATTGVAGAPIAVTAQATGNDALHAGALLRDGRILTTNHRFGVNVPGLILFSMFDPAANGGLGGFGAQSDIASSTQSAMSLTVLPSGVVLAIGVSGNTTKPVLYDPSTQTFIADDDLQALHRASTSTLLPGGHVLVIGGDFAATDVRTWPGAVDPSEAAIATVVSRQLHTATTLQDGKVLLAGGWAHVPDPPETHSSAELFDPVAKTFTATTNTMSAARVFGAATILSDGKVLVVGGATDTSETNPIANADVFDPTTGLFHGAGAMTVARSHPALARLPSGEVFVVSGKTAEIFDPKTETFHAITGLLAAHQLAGAVRLPNGLVLIVGGTIAELYDPVAATFRTTAAPAIDRQASSAFLLSTGKVFIAGGASASNELFDPVMESWSPAAALPRATDGMSWSPTPSGALFMSGAIGLNSVGATAQTLLFNPFGGAAGTTIVANAAANRWANTATLLPSTRVLVAGGDASHGTVFVPQNRTALLFGDGAPDATRPVVTSAPANVVGGDAVTITGKGFASGASSDAEAPIAFWVPDVGDTVIAGSVASFTDTSLVWNVPSTAFAGHGFFHVSIAGVASVAVPVAIALAKQAATCRFDAECANGICADGFCCDRACGGGGKLCEGCSAARKGSGIDGTCGTIPFGKEECRAPLGTQCKSAGECASNVCVGQPGAVCCDSACTGACLSCTLPDSVGTCRAIPNCDLTCDGDHLLKKEGAPDIDCSPFTCAGTTCRTQCASVNECAAPNVCSLDGVCIHAPDGFASPRETLLGCNISISPRSIAPSYLIGGIALSILTLARRRRRRRRRRR